MKPKDIILIIVVVFISAVSSFFISNALFGSPGSQETEVEVVQPIASDFTKPDPRYFNKDSLNPTQLIQIGGPGNPRPF